MSLKRVRRREGLQSVLELEDVRELELEGCWCWRLRRGRRDEGLLKLDEDGDERKRAEEGVLLDGD